jgi:TetR/AcrR family transcriptional repressor of nem operon
MATTKGDRTRARIVAAAAPLFNQRGYAGASMTDLMAATGLEKGGIYRHFGSKDALALAAFDHAVTLHGARIHSFVAAETGAVARLAAVGAAMASVFDDPILPGGCPLLNTATESDDAAGASYAALRVRAQAAMRQFLRYVARIVEQGMASGELTPGLDPRMEAAMIVATMEGAVMLTKLYDDPAFLRQAALRIATHAARLARTATS